MSGRNAATRTYRSISRGWVLAATLAISVAPASALAAPPALGDVGGYHLDAQDRPATVYSAQPPLSSATSLDLTNEGPGSVLLLVRYYDRGIPKTREYRVDPGDPPLRVIHPFVTYVELRRPSGTEAKGKVVAT